MKTCANKTVTCMINMTTRGFRKGRLAAHSVFFESVWSDCIFTKDTAGFDWLKRARNLLSIRDNLDPASSGNLATTWVVATLWTDPKNTATTEQTIHRALNGMLKSGVGIVTKTTGLWMRTKPSPGRSCARPFIDSLLQKKKERTKSKCEDKTNNGTAQWLECTMRMTITRHLQF